jgi:hypothetical protein
LKYQVFLDEFEGIDDSERRFYLIYKRVGRVTNKFQLVFSIKGREDSEYFKDKYIIGKNIFIYFYHFFT